MRTVSVKYFSAADGSGCCARTWIAPNAKRSATSAINFIHPLLWVISILHRLDCKRRRLIELESERGALEEHIVHACTRRNKTCFVNTCADRFRELALLPDAGREKDEH